jgi:hypothetical protein
VKNGHRFRAGNALRVWIRAREMADERAVRLAVRDMEERKMRDVRLGRAGRHERRKREIVHEPSDRRALTGREMFGNVDAHRCSPLGAWRHSSIDSIAGPQAAQAVGLHTPRRRPLRRLWPCNATQAGRLHPVVNSASASAATKL